MRWKETPPPFFLTQTDNVQESHVLQFEAKENTAIQAVGNIAFQAVTQHSAVGVVDAEVAWQWNVVVVGVVNCKLPVEVGCVEVAADEGLVMTELEVDTVPGDPHGGSEESLPALIGHLWTKEFTLTKSKLASFALLLLLLTLLLVFWTPTQGRFPWNRIFAFSWNRTRPIKYCPWSFLGCFGGYHHLRKHPYYGHHNTIHILLQELSVRCSRRFNPSLLEKTSWDVSTPLFASVTGG